MEIIVILSLVVLLVLGALFVLPKSRNKGSTILHQLSLWNRFCGKYDLNPISFVAGKAKEASSNAKSVVSCSSSFIWSLVSAYPLHHLHKISTKRCNQLLFLTSRVGHFFERQSFFLLLSEKKIHCKIFTKLGMCEYSHDELLYELCHTLVIFACIVFLHPDI